jgi:hypothetical protein
VFEEMFGSTSKDYYTPYAVEQYLRSAGTVTIVRVLNTAGYSVDSLKIMIGATTSAVKASLTYSITRIDDGQEFELVGSDGTYTFVASDAPLPSDVGNTYFFLGSGSEATINTHVAALAAEMTTKGGVTVSASSADLHISASDVGTAANDYSFKSGSTTTSLSEGADAVGATTLAVLAPSLRLVVVLPDLKL